MSKKSSPGNLLSGFILLGIIAYMYNLVTGDGEEEKQKERDKEVRVEAAKNRTPCERALASYDTEKWYYTKALNQRQSKWRSVDCSHENNCPGYTGSKRYVSQRTYGDSYHFSRTDAEGDKCSTNIHNFTCKYERPVLNLEFATRDVNQVLNHINVPRVGILTEHVIGYEYEYGNGYRLGVWTGESNDCTYIKMINYSHREYSG